LNLLKRPRIKPRGLVDQPLWRLAHAVAAEHGLDLVAVHYVADPGMTEQQVAEVSNNRVPDRVVMTTCGTETPKPFACKVFVYEGALRAGQYDPKPPLTWRPAAP